MKPGIEKELTFKAVRSSGKGGQNVNKVSTKVELYFDLEASEALTDDEKSILREKLKHLLNDRQILRIVSQETRSQSKNRELAIGKFKTLIDDALKPVKKRKKMRTPASVKEKRLSEKKQRSEIKAMRRRGPDEN